MSRSFKPPHADRDRQHDALTGDVIYLAKRSTYEFVLTRPETCAHPLNNGGQALFRVRFRNHPCTRAVTLDVEALTDFYQGLGQLMDYLGIEREKSRDGCKRSSGRAEAGLPDESPLPAQGERGGRRPL